MLYHVVVRADLDTKDNSVPLMLAVGNEILGELELDHGRCGDRFVARFEPAEPSDAVTVSLGRIPIPWPGRRGPPLAFAARLEPGPGVALTPDGFVHGTHAWTLRLRLRADQPAAKVVIRAFDANSTSSPADMAITYDSGELIASFDSLELPAVVTVLTPPSPGARVGELTISAEA